MPDKEEKLAALRESVTAAGKQLPADTRHRIVNEAVVQFQQNNAVVAEFSMGWRAVLHAMQVSVAALPTWAVAGATAAAAAGVFALAGGGGMLTGSH